MYYRSRGNNMPIAKISKLIIPRVRADAIFCQEEHSMKQNVFRRILALLLTASFLCGGGVAASAEDQNTNTSVSETTLSSLKEVLSADSYNTYVQQDLFKYAAIPTESIVIDAADEYDADKTTDGVYRVKIDEANGCAVIVADDYQPKDGEVIGLYTPDFGEVSFNLNIPQTAKYSIAIEYYPLASLVDAEGNTLYTDKSGSIERVLKIDGKVPFAEARYLVMSKVWKNIYTIKMSVDSNGKYSDVTEYVNRAKKCGIEYTVADDKSSITLELPDGGWTSEILDKISADDLRFFTTDIDDNEIRCAMERIPEIRTFECKDVDGFYSESFEFVFEEGERTLALESKNQGLVVKSITLFPQEDLPSYDSVKAGYESKGYKKGGDIVKFEAEYIFAGSSQTVYPIEDNSSAVTSPSSTKATVLNTMGGEKWQTSGQWVRYSFQVDEDGLYQISSRYRQNINDGIFSSRVLYLYSEGLNEGDDGYYDGIPFEEATALRFGYNSSWQVAPLHYSKEVKNSKGETEWEDVPVEFYFKAGVTYTMELEIALGDMGDIVSTVSESLNNINSYYLSILKLTGASPDQYTDYGFYRIMPDVMIGIISESENLYKVAEKLKIIAGEKSSNVATLEKVAWLLGEMGSNNGDNVAKYMGQLKTYIGTLGTWVNTAKTQPLQLDYFLIQSSEQALPKAKAGFFQAIWHEICKFFQSFFRNYDRMGATSEAATGDDAVEVWLAKGRDQTQVIRNLINNDFTPQYGHLVNLKLVAGGALLPSILSGSGPDVYIGIGEDNIINYAIRGALNNIENFEGFYDLTSQYQMEIQTIDGYIEELKADNYIMVESGNKLEAKSADNVTLYTIEYNSDGSGTVYDNTPVDTSVDKSVVCYFDKDGNLYDLGSTFNEESTTKTYRYDYKLDENGNRVVNQNAQFNEAAMYVLGLPDGNNVMHYYGLPEEQSFSMMFVRNDILADLGIEIPKTWDDLQEAIPVLQANNMQIGMPNEYRIFLYQKGSQLFADNGMRINLDSNVGLDSFDYMCNLFTMYSFPYKYDAANRFRTGEMPILIAGYNGTYNQLIVFATEIRGLWSFYPLPGIATTSVDEEGNEIVNINNASIATVSAISMINGCDNEKGAWDFMRWHVGFKCQVDYSNEMVAILGDSAKYASANIKALESMPWTTAEYQQLKSQFDNLASIPNYPGSYIIGRYTKFAFLAAYDDKENPADALQEYIEFINKEINRKREEFGLETIDSVNGETLASKRIDQAMQIINGIDSANAAKYKAEIDAITKIIYDEDFTVKGGNPTATLEALEAAVWNLRLTQYSKFFEAAEYFDEAIASLYEYQASDILE